MSFTFRMTRRSYLRPEDERILYEHSCSLKPVPPFHPFLLYRSEIIVHA